MVKPQNSDQPIANLTSGLEGLGKRTTAAELVRTQGQSKQLQVITQKTLMDWIRSLINQQMAGRADTFSDQEKDKMLKDTKEQLDLRIKREKDAQAERDRMKVELETVMANVANSQSSTTADQEKFKEAIRALKEEVDKREHERDDLQQDIYVLEEQLNDKLGLVSATIAEKDKLKETVKNQMRRSNALVESVMGLDASLYGSRHAEENPVLDDADDESEFYHDFEVGTMVIDTLSNDLQRLRNIAKKSSQKDQELSDDPRMNLLESDLQLLEQLKDGNLGAVDLAEPVEGLLEATNGARTEAQQLERTGKTALGVAAGREDALSAVPDTDSGGPATVLAGTTSVVRELAAVMARGRQRLTVLKEMADQADEARNTAEQELEEFRGAYQQVLGKLAERAAAEKIHVPMALKDADAPTEESRDKAIAIITQLRGGGDDAGIILHDQILRINEILGHDAGVTMKPPAANADTNALVSRLREDSDALARLIQTKSTALAAAAASEKALAEEIHALAKNDNIMPEHTSDHQLDASIVNLSKALADSSNSKPVGNAAQQVIVKLREQLAKAPSSADIKRLDDERARLASQIGQAQQKITQLENALAQAKADAANVQSSSKDRSRAERDMAKALVASAQGDEQLAEAVADLAMVTDSQEDENLSPALTEAVTGLVRRKQDLSEENQRLSKDLSEQKAKTQEAEKRNLTLQSEQDKRAAQLAQAQQHVQDLERDLSRTKTDLDLMRNQAQEANSKRTSVDADRAKAVAQVESLEQRLRSTENDLHKATAELAAAKASSQARYDAERAIATELVRAAQGDAELAEATADLALSLEDTDLSASPVDNAIVARQAADSIAILAKRKFALQQQSQNLKQEVDSLKWKLKEATEDQGRVKAEADDMMTGVKDIITNLTAKRDRTVAELEELKKVTAEEQSKLARFQHRTNAAETANRQLAEALSRLAEIEKEQGSDDVEDKRVDLELALSQLPDEGEDAVTIPEDLSLQLASSGQKLAQALLSRRQAMTTHFKRAKADQESLKGDVEKIREELAAAQKLHDELNTSLRSSQSEVKAVRQELLSQGKDLSAKVQELTNIRGDMASKNAELDAAAQRIEELDNRLQQNSAKLQESLKEHSRLVGDLSEQQQRADSYEHAQIQMVQLLRTLTNRQDAQPGAARALTEADMADPLSKAAQKLDMARAAGPEQMAIAGQGYIHALKDRIQLLAEELEDKRSQLKSFKTNTSTLQDELAALRASVVDRDHHLQNLSVGIEKAKHEHAELYSQLMDQRRARDDIAAQLKSAQEELRLAQADVADYQARDGASSGYMNGDIERLRTELNNERSQRERLEAAMSDLAEQSESGDARLKAQRDEFMRRLAERDHTIEQKERQLNDLAEQRADTKGLQAQVEALKDELAHSNNRIKEYEGVFGASAGANAKTVDLARELKKLNAERDQLREKLLQVEVENADAISINAQLKSQLEEKRKEVGGSRDKLMKEISDFRDLVASVREENRKLKEERDGMKARIRRLTDNTSGPSGGFPINK